MLKTLPSHSQSPEPDPISNRATCNGITVSGNPCRQVVANGFYNHESKVFCHNHHTQSRAENIFLKERWVDAKPTHRLVTGNSNKNSKNSSQRVDEDGSMRQLIAQFKRLFHSAPSTRYNDVAVATKRVVPVTEKKHYLPQVRRQPLLPLQPSPRTLLSPSPRHITPSTPITEKVPILRQCQAINRKNGMQCSRTFKGDTETFCFQHRKIPLENHAQVPNTPSLPNTLLKDFARYIPDHLSTNTKKLLYQELSKPLSQSDSPGYIYTYMLTSSSTATHALFKIGRTKNLHRRMYQWVSKCEYVPQLVECFPRTEDEEQVRFSHRVERLIHIELSDRYRADAEICGGCGGVHREWFKVTRDKGMSDKDMWLILREVVVRWVNYVAKAAPST
ncbi:meiotically up-regulated gene 113-domain-containing protein [Umbelopsis sp. PMI_123]|nr:meiotically up-regulated gene 113-domain-containing protein [Umbelopsis sp. PMI_123]